MRVSVLGPIVVESLEEALSPRDRVVLSALALECGEVVSGERIADALWGDDVPRSWNKVVQGCVVRLRKALGTNAIETSSFGYRLTIPPDDVDARRFERSLSRARELLAFGAFERAMYAAEEGLALWRGRPFVDVERWEPAQIEASRLSELRMEAEELRLDAAVRSGRHREVIGSARAGVEASPTRERRWELLALAQYGSGSQGDALRTLHEARAVLGRELGLSPGPDLVALEKAILQHDPTLAPAAAPREASTSCPWPGLLAYGVDDTEEFFGRAREVATCLERLAHENVVVVVGPSGSGKSSLVKAGVAAALRRNGHRVVVVTPGRSRPVDALTVLPSSGKPPVLVVDQCEEAVAPDTDRDEQRAFFDALLTHASRGSLVIALRADRVGEVATHEEFARLIERGLFLLGPMSEVDLRSAIEGPARQAALMLEPGLVDLIVRDVLDEPGALPLMSHALRQTWSRRQGRTLTVAAYRETGGIHGAVAQSAESVYAAVDIDERPQVRDLLLRLVSPIEHGEVVRMRLPRRALASDPRYEHLIERMVTARLLTSDGEVIELAHEALARAWPRLKDWLQEDVEGLRLLRHLDAAATGWDALGRPESELYRGVRLAQAVEWRSRASVELTDVERSFIAASVDREAGDLRTAQSQVVHERRTVRRLRRLVLAVGLLAVVAVIASTLAVRQRDRADSQARIAEARRLSAQALVARPYDRALLLAVEAVRRWDSAETRGNLLTTIGRSSRVAGVIRGPGPRLLDLELTPTGDQVAVADGFGALTIYDIASRSQVATLADKTVSYRAPAFSPDGTALAVSRWQDSCRFQLACTNFGVDLFSAADLHAQPVTYEGLGAPAADVAFSPRGDLIAAVPPFSVVAAADNIAIWRVGQPAQPLRRFTLTDPGIDLRPTPDDGPPGWVAFSPDGTRLYASGAGPTVVFDVATGEAIRSFAGIGALALSPNGETLAVATTGAGIELVDTSTGLVRATLTGHDGLVTAASFSPDGTSIATTSNDETVRVWNAATGEQQLVLEGHAGSVRDVVFSRDASTLFTSAADGSVLVWDVSGSSGLGRTLAPTSLDGPGENAVLVSPTADSVAVLAESAHIIDLATKRIVALAVEPSEVGWGAYSPDGRRLVTVGWDGRTKLWRVDDGAMVASAPGRGHDNLGAIAFTVDGRGVVVADADGTVVELDSATLAPTGRSVAVGLEPAGIRTTAGGVFAVTASPPDPSGGTDIVFGDLDEARVVRRVHIASWGVRANFNADGSRYAVGGFDGKLGVIDVAAGTLQGPRDPVHAGPIAWVTFSPDGKTVASLGFDGELTLSDAATGSPRARVLPGAANRRGSVGYRPDGHTAIVAYTDGSVIAFETDARAWVDHACRVAGRNLTDDEWRDALGDVPRRDTCPAGS